MRKRFIFTFAILALAGIVGTACKEELVGAPCIPETDKGDFNQDLSGTTWSIETRSLQCDSNGAKMVCLTQTQNNPFAGDQADICADNPTYENCWASPDGGVDIKDKVQFKFSFCSCRCDGPETTSDNADKAEDLCECPPDTFCEPVLGEIEGGTTSKVAGSYCVPDCIKNGCPEEVDKKTNETIYSICSPSTNSEEPWKWKCVPITDEE